MGLFGDKKKVVTQPDTTGKPGKNKKPPWGDQDPPNRGGNTPIEPPANERGRTLREPRECKACDSGVVESAVKRKKADGTVYTDYVESPCPTCKGSGTI